MLHPRRFSVSPNVVRAVGLTTVVSYALLVLTGGAVRLTGSGLGCPDWPSCYQHRFVAAVSFHPMIEDLNRFFTVTVSIVSVAALLVALFRSPRRQDITWPAAGLVVGLVAQIILGGLVVLFKLNPYLVALHFVLTIVVLADAIAMYHRAGIPDEAAMRPVTAVVGRELRLLVGVLIVVLSTVTMAGTVVTGSGPHAGSPGTSRIPIEFRAAAEFHSSIAWMLLGLVAASVLAFKYANAPDRVQRRVRTLFELVVVQGALGYTQYFLHDAAVVVEIHLAGVTMLWIVLIGLYLSLHEHSAPTSAEAAAEASSAVVAAGDLSVVPVAPGRPAPVG